VAEGAKTRAVAVLDSDVTHWQGREYYGCCSDGRGGCKITAGAGWEKEEEAEEEEEEEAVCA
jgi:hypothetical protein